MKFNWGFKIALVYVVFVIGIMYMVFLTSKQNRDLVSDDYYAEELAYQKVIDQSSKTASLQSHVEISTTGNAVQVSLPKEFEHAAISGNWSLYYAANQEKDIKGSFQTSAAAFSINIPNDVKGNYLLKLHWKSNKEEYYFEKPIFLQ
jgi:hypothetical protein